jgi:hypothetical protein
MRKSLAVQDSTAICVQTRKIVLSWPADRQRLDGLASAIASGYPALLAPALRKGRIRPLPWTFRRRHQNTPRHTLVLLQSSVLHPQRSAYSTPPVRTHAIGRLKRRVAAADHEQQRGKNHRARYTDSLYASVGVRSTQTVPCSAGGPTGFLDRETPNARASSKA